MWQYRWVETVAGNDADDTLSRLGADGWEAVGMTVVGEHFGNAWVRVLLKRPLTTRIDLTTRAEASYPLVAADE